jgi:methylmalonyl-CoA/ethylmalonyl-CoA epimerase
MKRLTHVGIAVKNLKDSVDLFSRLLQIDEVEHEVVQSQRVNLAFFRLGEASIELTASTDPESPIAKFIGKRGEGVHHLSFEVDDIEAELARLRSDGFQLIDEKPRAGAGGHLIAFLHPKSTNGVLVEICQRIHPPDRKHT